MFALHNNVVVDTQWTNEWTPVRLIPECHYMRKIFHNGIEHKSLRMCGGEYHIRCIYLLIAALQIVWLRNIVAENDVKQLRNSRITFT